MRNLILFLLLIPAFTASGQAVEYLVICNQETQLLEVITADELSDYDDAVVLKNKLPNRMAATSWISSNYSSSSCNSKISVVEDAPVPPPPPTPGTQDVKPEKPPKKRVTHIYDNDVTIFGNALFAKGDWATPTSGGADFVPFMAGFSYRGGNKAKFGIETTFQGWGKVAIPGDDPKMLATATASFVFSWPVALDKQGRFWVLPEAGIGVDFFDLFQIGDDLGTDQKFAAPSFFLRVGVEAYHVRPFFYYGRTMIDVYDNFSVKPNHIGAGIAISF